MADGADVAMETEEAVQPVEVPSQTLYVHNLSERVRKDELTKCLLAVFSQFGPVRQVVSGKAHKLRGQAWVVFQSMEAAVEAKALMEGFPLYEKPLRLQYARTQSDVLAKEQGTFLPRPAYDKAKRKAEVKQELGRKRRAKEAAAALAPPSIAAAPPPRLAPTIAAAPAPYPLPALRPPFPGAYEEALPHKILFVQGLGEKVEPGVLQALFSQFPGFREVRTVEAKGIAFVDYDSEPLAGAALAGLQGFKLDGEPITVTYAKR